MLQPLAVRAIWFAMAGFALASPARGDHSSIHATATGDVATTDNVLSAPSGGREGDVYVQIRPGVLFAYDTPRLIQDLAAELEVLEYAEHSHTPSLTARAGWRAVFTSGPRSELTMVANASSGRLNAITARTSPDQTSVGAVPAGEIKARQADASAQLGWQATHELRLAERGLVRWAATTDGLDMPTTTDSIELGAAITMERAFRHDTLGLDLGTGYVDLERIAPPTPISGSSLVRAVEPQALALWRHDFDAAWSLAAEAGALLIAPIGTDPYAPALPHPSGWYPVAGALVAYSQPWGHASLAVRHAVAANLLLAQNTVGDSATAQVAIPLPWLDDNPHAHAPKLVALGSLGVERSAFVDPRTAMTLASFELLRVDLGVGWTPKPGQTYGVRYELAVQHGNAAAAATIAPSFYRNTVFFTFALRIPDRLTTDVPIHGASVRADRGDVAPAPADAEPVVPAAPAPADD